MDDKSCHTWYKCKSRILPCVEVTAEDVAVFKVGIHFYKNVERFNINYEKLSEISKDDNSMKVSKVAKIRNRYNQVPHLTQDTNGKVTN